MHDLTQFFQHDAVEPRLLGGLHRRLAFDKRRDLLPR